MTLHCCCRSIAADRFVIVDRRSAGGPMGRADSNSNGTGAAADRRNGRPANVVDRHRGQSPARHNYSEANAYRTMIVEQIRNYSHHNQVTMALALASSTVDIVNSNH